MDIVVEFWGGKSISLNCNLSVQDPVGKDQSCGESIFKCFKGRMALIREIPRGTLAGKLLHPVTP